MVTTHERKQAAPEARSERLSAIKEQAEHVEILEGELEEAREQVKHKREAVKLAQLELRKIIRGDVGLPFPDASGDVSGTTVSISTPDGRSTGPVPMKSFREKVDAIVEGKRKRGRSQRDRGDLE